MASNKLLVILAIMAVSFPTAAMASEFWVGDASGWTVGYDYQAWAKDKVFQVGDTLEGNHNVIEANKTTFDSCIIPPENVALLLASGHDVITLATQGEKWYICGVSNHCSELNQKLAITVEGGALPPELAPSPPPNTSNSSDCGYECYIDSSSDSGYGFLFYVMIIAGLLLFVGLPICVLRELCGGRRRILIPVRGLWVEV
ncbi:unnamed protein product [Ilex paraguariensis]|uniref:Phytocyanin domain-containing protein n=1 Tax=Ilex paraguariensis TaxID=185542 RepID=A0ABC8UJ51_9AQUA